MIKHNRAISFHFREFPKKQPLELKIPAQKISNPKPKTQKRKNNPKGFFTKNTKQGFPQKSKTNPFKSRSINIKELERERETKTTDLPGINGALEILKPAVGAGAKGIVGVVVEHSERLLDGVL